jgi:hypothetical protein
MRKRRGAKGDALRGNRGTLPSRSDYFDLRLIRYVMSTWNIYCSF